MKLPQLLEKIAGMKTSTVLMVMIALGGLYYKNGYDSGSSIDAQIIDLTARLSTENEKKTKTEQAQKEADVARNSVKNLAQDFDKISKKLPSNIASVDMIRAMDGFVAQSGVKQISVRPGTEVKQEIYDEFPFVVQLEGSFAQISLFIYHVAKAERIASVKEFAITRKQPLGEEPLKFEATVVNYKLAEEKAPVILGEDGQPLPPGENQ
jgi:Tfp pilus assembly protein PilO